MKIRRVLDQAEFVVFEAIEKGFDPEYILINNDCVCHIEQFKQTMKVEYLDVLSEHQIDVTMDNIREEFNRIQYSVVHVF